jgi:hypothetical protein
MKPPECFIDNQTLGWLLEEENPSVKYFTLRCLFGKSEADHDVLETRQTVMTNGLVPAILSGQEEGGYWGVPDRFYNEKYRGTVWQMMILAELGADRSDPRIQKMVEFIFANSQERDEGGFSYRRSEKAGGGLACGVVPCLTGNMVWSLVRLGYLNDERTQKGINWICRYQRADDGTKKKPTGPPYDRYDMCWGRHSCHMGVVKSLKALAEIPEGHRSAEVQDKADQLAEYILVHRIHKKSHDTEKVSRPGWLRLGFPLMYQTDILEILGILTRLGHKDTRMGEAVDILRSKQNGNGRWKMENSFNGRMIKDIEKKGLESKWVTLKAVEVMMGQE